MTERDEVTQQRQRQATNKASRANSVLSVSSLSSKSSEVKNCTYSSNMKFGRDNNIIPLGLALVLRAIFNSQRAERDTETHFDGGDTDRRKACGIVGLDLIKVKARTRDSPAEASRRKQVAEEE